MDERDMNQGGFWTEHQDGEAVRGGVSPNVNFEGVDYFGYLISTGAPAGAPSRLLFLVNKANREEVMQIALFPPREGAPDFVLAGGSIQKDGRKFFVDLKQVDSDNAKAPAARITFRAMEAQSA